MRDGYALASVSPPAGLPLPALVLARARARRPGRLAGRRLLARVVRKHGLQQYR